MDRQRKGRKKRKGSGSHLLELKVGLALTVIPNESVGRC